MKSVNYHAPAFAGSNGLELCFDSFGDPAAPPLLLVSGLGAQLIAWDDEFCRQLASAGLYVVRYDNRDVGLSTHFTAAGVPDLMGIVAGQNGGGGPALPYTLDEMAADAVGLLDALELPDAHLLGLSMGGMIAQLVALDHPRRVRSLISVMSTTGERDLPPADAEAIGVLLGPPPTDREQAAERSVAAAHILGGSFPVDEARVRRRARAAFERETDPTGGARQLAAVLATPGRANRLATLALPALVLHGDADPLIPLAHGEATAAAIPGARLEVIAGLGHRLPPPAWPQFTAAVTGHIARCEAAHSSVK